jgi:hypothetical protein
VVKARRCTYGAGDVAQVVLHLPTIREVLGSIPSPAKKKKASIEDIVCMYGNVMTEPFTEYNTPIKNKSINK